MYLRCTPVIEVGLEVGGHRGTALVFKGIQPQISGEQFENRQDIVVGVTADFTGIL